MTAIDQTKIFQKYKGQWVLLDHTRTKVLSADTKLKNAVAKFRQKHGQKYEPILFKVPTELVAHIGFKK